MEDLHIFDKNTLRIVCISDTHNDDPSAHMPDGDMLIHAGDMTDDGTEEELQAAYDWLTSLSYPVKVVIAGNHDLGLDEQHDSYSGKSRELFTSAAARKAGIRYLDREIGTVAKILIPQATGIYCEIPLRVYANSMTPDFLKSRYAFTYEPAPSASASQAWKSCPAAFPPDRLEEYAPIHVSHGAPLGYLDNIPIQGLSGCSVQAEVVQRTRPMLCVFGHYHCSRGAALMNWASKHVQMLCEPWEIAEEPDFSEKDLHPEYLNLADGPNAVVPGKHTVFCNVAWMTLEKRKVARRNPPFVVDLVIPSSF